MGVWYPSTSRLCCHFSTQPKVTLMFGTGCFHPNPEQPHPGEASRKAPAPHGSSGHVLASHTQILRLCFVLAQVLLPGEARVSLRAVVSPARQGCRWSSTAESPEWVSPWVVPRLPGGCSWTAPPPTAETHACWSSRARAQFIYLVFHYVTSYYFGNSTLLLKHHPSNTNLIWFIKLTDLRHEIKC